MQVIKREMQAEVKIRTADNNINEYLPKSQASFNSDNCITIRNFDARNKNRDEIIVLTPTETDAIFLLFSRLGVRTKNYTLPF